PETCIVTRSCGPTRTICSVAGRDVGCGSSEARAAAADTMTSVAAIRALRAPGFQFLLSSLAAIDSPRLLNRLSDAPGSVVSRSIGLSPVPSGRFEVHVQRKDVRLLDSVLGKLPRTGVALRTGLPMDPGHTPH